MPPIFLSVNSVPWHPLVLPLARSFLLDTDARLRSALEAHRDRERRSPRTAASLQKSQPAYRSLYANPPLFSFSFPLSPVPASKMGTNMKRTVLISSQNKIISGRPQQEFNGYMYSWRNWQIRMTDEQGNSDFPWIEYVEVGSFHGRYFGQS